MSHHIILDPGLGLSAQQFAEAWNRCPDCKKAATAQVAMDGGRFYDPTWAEMVNLIVAPLLLGVAGNALYDLIKSVLPEAGVRRRTQIIHQVQPDGSELTVITIDEEG